MRLNELIIIIVFYVQEEDGRKSMFFNIIILFGPAGRGRLGTLYFAQLKPH